MTAEMPEATSEMSDDFKKKIEDFIADKNVEGWATSEKALAMASLILKEQPSRVVEIGVFGGKSLIPQAMALKENGCGTIYGIDPWKLDSAIEGEVGEANADWWRKIDLHDIHRKCMEEIWKQGLDDFIAIMRCPSQNAARLFPTQSIDILHIDGCHSEVSSVRDVQLYLPLVRPGGFVFADDADWKTTGKAFEILNSSLKAWFDVGSCRLFQKP